MYEEPGMPLQVITRHLQTTDRTYIFRSMPSNSTQTIAPAPAHDLSGNVTAELMYLKDKVTQAANREDGPKYAGKKPVDLEMSNPESVTWSKHWRLYVAIGFVAVLVLM